MVKIMQHIDFTSVTWSSVSLSVLSIGLVTMNEMAIVMGAAAAFSTVVYNVVKIIKEIKK